VRAALCNALRAQASAPALLRGAAQAAAPALQHCLPAERGGAPALAEAAAAAVRRLPSFFPARAPLRAGAESLSLAGGADASAPRRSQPATARAGRRAQRACGPHCWAGKT
jgi:hypothetical protein